MRTVAALYVDLGRGPYPTLPGVECWGFPERDANHYPGDHPIVAHPPCAPWGCLSWSHERMIARGGSSVDGTADCGPIAVAHVRRWGGVLEHPAGSKLWDYCELPPPGRGKDQYGGWTLKIRQSDFGHQAQKLTWLYVVGVDFWKIPELPVPKKATIRAAGGQGPEVKKRERDLTPPDLAKWLVLLARSVE